MGRRSITIEDVAPDAPCFCGGCGWTGRADALVPCEDAILTPGDASPAGRCPDCEALAYLDRPEDRARDEALNAVKVLRDLCEWAARTGDWESPAWDRARALLRRVDGVADAEVAA